MKILHLTLAILLCITFLENNAQIIIPTEGYVLHDNEGYPKMVLNLNKKYDVDQAIDASDQFLQTNKNWITQGENSIFVCSKMLVDSGSTHIVYQQKINNIPIDGSVVIITLDKERRITMVYNGYKRNIQYPGNLVYDSVAAQTIAIKSLPFDYSDHYQ